MKKLFAIAFALALTAHLVTAQAGNTGTDKTSKPAAKHKTKRTPPAAEKPATTQDKVSLNPQPLPPKPQPNTAAKKKTTSQPTGKKIDKADTK